MEVVVLMVVIEQDGGHGHSYARLEGWRAVPGHGKVKRRKWGIWNDAAVGLALRTSAY